MSDECKVCGAQVAGEAKTCPGCGAVVATKAKLLPLAAFMLIFILILQSYINKSEEGVSEAKPPVPVTAAE